MNARMRLAVVCDICDAAGERPPGWNSGALHDAFSAPIKPDRKEDRTRPHADA
jgi:hypothetical protein